MSCLWSAIISIKSIWACAALFGLLVYSMCKLSSIFDVKYLKRKLWNSFQNSMFSLEKWRWQTCYFGFLYHKKSVSTVALDVDNSSSMEVVIAKKKKKEKRKKEKLAKLKTRKGGLGKNERPGGSKTRKGGPGKNKGHTKNTFPVNWKPERAIQAKVRDFKRKNTRKRKQWLFEGRMWKVS